MQQDRKNIGEVNAVELICEPLELLFPKSNTLLNYVIEQGNYEKNALGKIKRNKFTIFN